MPSTRLGSSVVDSFLGLRPSRMMQSMSGRTRDGRHTSKGRGASAVSASVPNNPQSQRASAVSDEVGRIEEGRSVVWPSTLPEPQPVRASPSFDTSAARTDSVAPDPRKDLKKMVRRRYQYNQEEPAYLDEGDGLHGWQELYELRGSRTVP